MCYCARAVTLVASPLVSWNFGEAWVRGMFFFFFFFKKEKENSFFDVQFKYHVFYKSSFRGISQKA